MPTVPRVSSRLCTVLRMYLLLVRYRIFMIFFPPRLVELWHVSESDGQYLFSSSSTFHSAHTEATPKSQRVSESFVGDIRHGFGGRFAALISSARNGTSDFLPRIKSGETQSMLSGIHEDGAQENMQIRKGVG